MNNILSKYPIIILLLFCFTSLLFGFEVGSIINYGLPATNSKLIIKILSLTISFSLAINFLNYYIKLKTSEIEISCVQLIRASIAVGTACDDNEGAQDSIPSN